MKHLEIYREEASQLIQFVQVQCDDVINLDPLDLDFEPEKLSMYSLLKGVKESELRRRVKLLQNTSSSFMTVLPAIDLSLSDKDWSFANLILRMKDVLFRRAKETFLEGILRQTDSEVAMIIPIISIDFY